MWQQNGKGKKKTCLFRVDKKLWRDDLKGLKREINWWKMKESAIREIILVLLTLVNRHLMSIFHD